MRSGSFAWLLETAGMKATILQKGYKAYRQEVLQTFNQPLQLLVLGGKTGSGKTDILRELEKQGEQVLDLEGLAHHKGSSFGALGQEPQPTTEQFENNLHQAWLKLDTKRRVWIEDESMSIGTVHLPSGLWSQMRSAPVVFVGVPKAWRIRRLVQEYGSFSVEQLIAAVNRIQKRLGGQHHRMALDALAQGDYALVADLTLSYYDKAYLHGLSQRTSSRIFEIALPADAPAESAEKLLCWANATDLKLGW
jgi:tRNA 2-selenouridine synthase